MSPEVLHGNPVNHTYVSYQLILTSLDHMICNSKNHGTDDCIISFELFLIPSCIFLFVISVDLWALGCTIYQMLEGRPPFQAPTEYLTFQKVMGRQLSIPSHFSPEAKDLIERLLVSIMMNSNSFEPPDFSFQATIY